MILIDSNILIWLSRGNDEAAEWVERNRSINELAISAVTKMELLIGCRDKRHLKETIGFLENYYLLEINEAISKLSVQLVEQYFLSHGLQVADAIIAATALEHDLALATINRKDFRFIDGLKLVDYP